MKKIISQAISSFVACSLIFSVFLVGVPTAAASGSTMWALVVAGGGGGGSANISNGIPGGGGGAGGYQVNPSLLVTSTTYTVTVGAGGTGGVSLGQIGNHGATSSFDTLLVAYGGKGGDGTSNAAADDPNEYFAQLTSGIGSGCGASNVDGSGFCTSGRGGQGHNGGAGNSTGSKGSGGGGGAESVGADGNSNNGGAGGMGTSSSITGASVCYAGGGGGSTISSGSVGSATCGGTSGTHNADASAATANTGGGGGGSGGSGKGGNGGSGVVIVRWITKDYGTIDCVGGGGTLTTSGTDSICTFTSSGTFTVVPNSMWALVWNWLRSFKC